MSDTKQLDPRCLDLSHKIRHGLITYKGLPAPVITEHLSRHESRRLYAGGTEFHIGKIEMVANTGTYLDSGYHRFPDGHDISELPLERIANLQALCITPAHYPVDSRAFAGRSVAGKAVLVNTGWSAHWDTDKYFEGAPFLTEDAARFLAEQKVALVGIDSVNIDDMNDKRRPVHTALLREEIPIVEHLTNLDQLPVEGFRFFAVPVKVVSMGTFPVRAFALIATSGRTHISSTQ